MPRFLSVILLLRAGFGAALPTAGLYQETAEIESRLTALTGLPFKHHVQYQVISRDQLRRYLNEKVRQTLKPEDLRIQQAVLTMLGLVPKGFDLKTTMVDLLTEQAAAFYDYNKKKLFLLDTNEGSEAKIALVHEMAHALADQNFHLDKYVNESGRSDDSETARLAVMEGQATWLMTAYMANSANGGIPDFVLRDRPDLLTESASEYPVFANAPLYIRVSLVFPYAEGLLFQDALFRRYGKQAFRRVFLDPPVTTHQILHPEIYADQPPPKLPDPPKPPAQLKHLRKLAEGTLGEIDLRVLLAQAAGKEQGQAAAAHLNGAAYAYYEDKHKQNPILTFTTDWDSAAAARTFVSLYRKVLARRFTTLTIDQQDDHSLKGSGDGTQFEVNCTGASVSSLEGSLRSRKVR